MYKVGDFWLPDSDNYFGSIIEKTGGFDVDRLRLALANVENFRCAVDIGAHVGTWAKTMAVRFRSVIAFEPAPDTLACLARNLFGTGNVTIYPYAVGNQRVDATVMADPLRPGNTGARYMDFGKSGSTIRTVILDEVIDGRSDIDFIKIDVEGAEYKVVDGARKTIARNRPTVLIEVKKSFGSRYTESAEDALALLKDMGAHEIAKIGSDRILVFSK